MVQAELIIGNNRTGVSDGPQSAIRGGKTGEAIVSDAHGKYYEAVYRGNVFAAANQAAQTYTLFSVTTATGLILSNPSGSGKNLSLLEVGFMPAAAAAAAISMMCLSAGISQNVTTHTAALTIAN